MTTKHEPLPAERRKLMLWKLSALFAGAAAAVTGAGTFAGPIGAQQEVPREPTTVSERLDRKGTKSPSGEGPEADLDDSDDTPDGYEVRVKFLGETTEPGKSGQEELAPEHGAIREIAVEITRRPMSDIAPGTRDIPGTPTIPTPPNYETGEVVGTAVVSVTALLADSVKDLFKDEIKDFVRRVFGLGGSEGKRRHRA